MSQVQCKILPTPIAANIVSLNRYGLRDTCAPKYEYGLIDDMDYDMQTGTNLLNDITEDALTDIGYTAPSSTTIADYNYDAAGNVFKDGKSAMIIDYNPINLPTSASLGSIKAVWRYDADGNKYRRTTDGGPYNEERYYFDGIEYANDELEAIYFAHGRIVPDTTMSDGWRFEVFAKDHLGNTRVVLSDLDENGEISRDNSNGDDEILAIHHYYPFGMQMDGPWKVADPDPVNSYRYNGKEMNDISGLDWLDYGARWYDPAIGRFTGVDPISDQFPSLSVYNYASNEPIGHIDLHGLQGVKYTEVDKKGRDVTVIEADIHIATGEGGFSQKEVGKISKRLNKIFDKKVDGQKVDVRFNISTFDASSTDQKSKAGEVRRSSTVETASESESVPGSNRYSITGMVLGKDDLPDGVQGRTSVNSVTIDLEAHDQMHTIEHEVGHFLLLGSKDQPVTAGQHNAAGGVFKYGTRDPSGNVVVPTQNVTKDNVRKIVKNVPVKKQ